MSLSTDTSFGREPTSDSMASSPVAGKVGIAILDVQGRPVQQNPTFQRMLGYTSVDLREMGLAQITHPEDVELDSVLYQELVEGHRDQYQIEKRFIRKDGSICWSQLTVSLLRDGQGEASAIIAAIEDVTDREQFVGMLQRRDAILRAVSFAAERFLSSGAWEEDTQEVLACIGAVTSASRVYLFELDGGSTGAPLLSHHSGWSARGIEPLVGRKHLSLSEFGLGDWEEAMRRGETVHAQTSKLPPEVQAHLSARDTRSLVIVPIFAGDDWWGFIGFEECRSERVWSEAEREALQTAARTLGAAIQRHRTQQALRRSEEQLRQSQKMEAVGRLAGGIAHDFSNLLSIIGGNAQLALTDLAPESPVHEDLQEIARAVERATSLIQQLLTFSHRQIAQPEDLVLDEEVRKTGKMLHRLIGENIQLHLHPGSAGTVCIDPGQLSQVIVNLVVNARDALPQGEGSITVATDRVTIDKKAFLRLSVTDTGVGMDEATRERIFEPFFTTKGKGQGTGLGLSTVYGIVQQNGGHLEVESAPEQGTTIRVYLPQVQQRGTPSTAEPLKRSLPAGRGETVLLVEDEVGVRRLLRRVLERSGYEVLEAEHGVAALELASKHTGRIDLVLTDVVMPRMSGKEMADHFRSQWPQLPVLYMSGYTDDAVMRQGILRRDVPFLPKPARPNEVLRAVRRALTGAHA